MNEANKKVNVPADKPKPEPKRKEVSTHDGCDALAVELDVARKAAADNLNLAKYHKAELENFRKRNQEATVNAYREGRESIVVQIVPMIDALYEALKTVETQNDKEGIEVLIRKFQSTLAGFGVEEIEAEGTEFNPHLHNALCVEKITGTPPDIVLEVWQRGYKMRDRVIRVASVKVSG